MHGGVVSHLINDIDISCLASNLPEYLEIDVEEMDIGDSVFLSALKLPEGVEIPVLSLGEDRDQAVVSVTEAKLIDIEPEIVESEGEEGEGEGEGEEGEEGEEGSENSESSEGDSE
jgi:large subunit ribosomal protein L25